MSQCITCNKLSYPVDQCRICHESVCNWCCIYVYVRDGFSDLERDRVILCKECYVPFEVFLTITR